MNTGLNLATIAKELLIIQEDFQFYLKDSSKSRIEDFKMETFVQVWENTSGGLEGIGDSVMTWQKTYVFIPCGIDEDCYVYFGCRFGYSVPMSEKFLEDVKNYNVAGCEHKDRYLKDTMNSNLYFDKIEKKLDKMSDKELNKLLIECGIESEPAKKKNQESIFDNMTDEEFEQLLIECGFEYEFVGKGKGGVFISQ